jgi:hypothetical protein
MVRPIGAVAKATDSRMLLWFTDAPDVLDCLRWFDLGDSGRRIRDRWDVTGPAMTCGDVVLRACNSARETCREWC